MSTLFCIIVATEACGFTPIAPQAAQGERRTFSCKREKKPLFLAKEKGGCKKIAGEQPRTPSRRIFAAVRTFAAVSPTMLYNKPSLAARLCFYCTNGGVLPEILDLRKGMMLVKYVPNLLPASIRRAGSFCQTKDMRLALTVLRNAATVNGGIAPVAGQRAAAPNPRAKQVQNRHKRHAKSFATRPPPFWRARPLTAGHYT